MLLLLLFSPLVVSDCLQPHGLQHTRLPSLSLSPRVCSNSCPLSQWSHPQPSHPPPSPSHPVLNLSQHQGLFQWVSSSYQMAKVLELKLQQQSLQWIFRIDFLHDWLVWPLCCPSYSQESSPAPQFENINSLVLSFLYSPTLTSVHDHWKKPSSWNRDRVFLMILTVITNPLR